VRQQKQKQKQLELEHISSKKSMDSYIDTMTKMIEGDKNALVQAKKSKKAPTRSASLSPHPVSLQQQPVRPANLTPLDTAFSHDLCDDEFVISQTRVLDDFPPSHLTPFPLHQVPASPIAPPLWDKEKMSLTQAQTMCLAPPPPHRKAMERDPPPRRRTQKSFDQLVLTKQKSFDQLHVQRSDSFGPRTSFSFGSRSSFSVKAMDGGDELSAGSDDHSDGDGDLMDYLDKQILEKTLKAGSLDGFQTPLSDASVVQISPIKRPKRSAHPPAHRSSAHHISPHLGDSSDSNSPSHSESSIPHLPDLSPPPKRHLTRVNSIKRSNSKPFTPVDSAAKQRQEELKMKKLITPQEKRQAMKESRRQDSNLGLKGSQKQMSSVSNSFKSLSRDLSKVIIGDDSGSSSSASKLQLEVTGGAPKQDFGTLYDFVQKME
jgi:hypothetical protein